MKFNSNDFSFRPTTMSAAFERATVVSPEGEQSLLNALKSAGLAKGPHLVREAIIESDRGVIHTESARNAMGQILLKVA